MSIFKKIKKYFSQGFGPAGAGSKFVFVPIILLVVIVALLAVILFSGKKDLILFRSVSYSHGVYYYSVEKSQDESSSYDSSGSEETDDAYFESLSENISLTKPKDITDDGYSEKTVSEIKKNKFYKLVYAGTDEALRVSPDITDSKYTLSGDGSTNIINDTNVTMYLRSREETNSQEFVIAPDGSGDYYIISKSSSKALSNIDGYPLLQDMSLNSLSRRWKIEFSESGRAVITSSMDGAVLNVIHGGLSLENEELLCDDVWFVYEISSSDWQSVFVDNFDPGVISAKWVKEGNKLTTNGSWVFSGGRIEIRAKLKNTGAHIYLSSLTSSGDEARIDLLDAVPSSSVLNSCVSFKDGRKTEKHGKLGVGNTLTDWHEYVTEWESDQIRFYFDGVMYACFNMTTNAARSSFSGALMALTIDGFSSPYADNIDYVKFRQRKNEIINKNISASELQPIKSVNAGGECNGAAAVETGFAVACSDEVVFYDVNGKELNAVVGFGGKVTQLVPSGDGRKLLALCKDSDNAYIIDVATGEVTALCGHSAFVECGAVQYGGAVCVTASHDGTIIVWNTDSGVKYGSVSLGSWVRSIDITHDGTRFAVGSNDGTVRIYNTSTRKLISTFSSHKSPVTAVKFNSNGNVLATGDSAGKFMLWDTASETRYFLSSHNLNAIGEIGFCYGGNMAVTMGYDGALRLYDTSKGSASLKTVRSLYSSAVCDMECGKAVVSVGSDGKAYVCGTDLGAKYELAGTKGFMNSIALSDNGQYVLVCSQSGTANFYKIS